MQYVYNRGVLGDMDQYDVWRYDASMPRVKYWYL